MTATLTPQFRGDGTVWLIADSVSIGRLPLPPAWVFSGTPGDTDVLPKELDHDDGEVTATMKVRRNKVHEIYADEIEALYA